MFKFLKKTLKKPGLFSIFFIVGLFTQAQTNLDSLWSVWNDETASDSSRVQAIHNFARYGYLYSQPDSAYYFAQLMYDFASEKGFKKEMTSALSIQGGSYLVRGEYDDALDYYQRSLLISEGICDNKGMSKTLNNIGVIYSNQGNFPKALEYHQRSLTIKESLSDKSGMAGSMNNMGLIYMNQGNYPRALKNFQRSLRIKEEFSDSRGIAQILNNIGLIYMRRGDYPEALECFQRSLKICEDISDLKASAGISSNIGLIYMNLSDYSKALDYYLKSLKIQEEISDRKGMASTFNNIGEIYMYQGDYAKAMDYYQKCFNIYEEISDKRGLAGILANIGRAYNKQGDHAKAIIWCKRSLRTSEEINILLEQKNACQCLYNAFKALGNNDKALEYHERITELDSSLQAEETAKMLQGMEFEKWVLADSLIQEEEKLKVQMAHEAEVRKKNRTRNISILSAIILLIGAIGLYMRIVFVRRAKRAIENEKERSDKLLLNILPAEIAEELKEKGKAKARNFEKVSILFTDFKGFTQISEKLSAENLVGEINTCFESFDGICRKYGIEKIKTIGDSYMAAGGLPVPTADSVRNTVLAGIEMTECMINMKKQRDLEAKSSFEMRVGIHTGPVVAGIVGVTKFQYDIWGDTVNTASRMENSGETGQVNISQSTYELIKDDPAFRFQPRGKVKTKGKGEIEMWFVERA